MGVSFEDLPSPFFTRLLKCYLPLNDLVTLRSVNWKLRESVDLTVAFHVPINNTSLRWFNEIVPDITEVIVGPLSSPNEQRPLHMSLLQKPQASFPEVKSFTCLPDVNEAYFPKFQEIFPNIIDLTLRKLKSEELLRIMQLSSVAKIPYPDDLRTSCLWMNLQRLEVIIRFFFTHKSTLKSYLYS